MDQDNLTSPVTEFLLLGLSQSRQIQLFLFSLFLAVYATTWLGNLIIISTVISDPRLHTPMYFLLANLSVIDVSFSSVSVPKLLDHLLLGGRAISFNGCMAQMFFFHLSGGAEVFFLIVMAFDRYLAIYKPLHYLTIMNWDVCIGMVVGAWLGGFAHSFIQVAIMIHLPFCGPNVLDNFFCDVPQVLKLACTDTSVEEWLMLSNGGLVATVCFGVLLLSYTVILVMLRTRVSEGRQKAYNTCLAQITVVCLIFGPCIFIYARPFQNFAADKAVAVLYIVITPMLNPMIYTLRNTEMKGAIKRVFSRQVTWQCLSASQGCSCPSLLPEQGL
ncbi:olfactory receptor 4D1-like [Alligator mississippiensis]|uniref:olfactory receptor 4D1-like n=1 Tax=Alligator mississippiensis TaxID=8496 RepID=UPI002877BF14|nr:olfactory receptor 4D1-like [Alligator mississippiensis]